MSVYSKALRHVDNKDFRKTHQRRLDEQKVLRKIEREQQLQERKEVEEIKKLATPLKYDWRSDIFPQEEEPKQIEVVEEIKVNVPEKLKSNWREEFYSVKPEVDETKEEVIEVPEHLKNNWRKQILEGMVTTDAITVAIPATDTPLDTIDAADPASFTASVGGFDSQGPADGLSGAQIVSNGTGSGNNGGFNLGRSYLSFNGVGFNDASSPEFDNVRHIILTPVDASRATTIEITAIVGNGSNGGEAPSVNQDLQLWYTDATEPNILTAAIDDNGDLITVVPYNGSGSLRTYSVTLPSNEFNNLRRQGIQFVLYQNQGNNPSTTGDNYGITQIKVKRTTGINALVALNSPEATSFFRVATGPNTQTPEQRYRKTMQQLLASRSYTSQMFGSNYPGSNFSGLRGVSASPIGKEASYNTWSKEAERIEVERQNKIDEYLKSVRNIPITSTAISQMLYKNALKYAGYSDAEIAAKTNVRYIQPKQPQPQSQPQPEPQSEFQPQSQFQQPSALQSFNNIVQGKDPAFAVGSLEGMNSAKQSEVLNALGSSAKATFDQIQQYKQLNQNLSQSRNPSDWDKAAQVSASIQQLYSKFGQEMSGGISKSQPSGLPSYMDIRVNNNYNSGAKGNNITPLSNNPYGTEVGQISQFLPLPPAAPGPSGYQKPGTYDPNKFYNLGPGALPSPNIPQTGPGLSQTPQDTQIAWNTPVLPTGPSTPVKYDKFMKQYVPSGRDGFPGNYAPGYIPASYEPQGEIILEKKMKTFKQFTQGLYPGQPSPNGFPDGPTPQQLPNGFHQDYGKRANMYNTLDKTSAMSMPLTGDPEIDAKILKARKQPK